MDHDIMDDRHDHRGRRSPHGGGRHRGMSLAGGTPMRESERMVVALGGGLLTLWALRRGGLFATIAAMAGGAMLGTGLRNMEAGGGQHRGGTSGSGANRDAERQFARRKNWSDAVLVTQSVTIDAPRQKIYDFWRNFENLAQFMSHVERITVHDRRRSHWVVKAPVGQSVEWDAIVTDDRNGERIAWRAADGADVRNEGWVEFKDAGDNRTEVKAFIAYEPPAGQLGRMIAKVFGEEPSVQASDDLDRLKRLMESQGDGAHEALMASKGEQGTPKT